MLSRITKSILCLWAFALPIGTAFSPMATPITKYRASVLTLADATSADNEDDSLFARIGGTPAIKATVDAMYVRIIDDPLLASFFDGTDMKLQKGHQMMFLKTAFGGMKADFDIPTYILEKHSNSFDRGLNEKHFDAVAGHIVDSLVALEVPQDLIDEAVAVVVPLRPLFEKKE
mmetsp:Transcript_8847/g.14717  ORF Transcript_8847/g.14717 Transcript_8847/m.14717 type:complete len:174 (-) Transcript_8847:124-645(-)|eukprot:CAMPEP_0119013110 /NCGR_PEP_ID=MMETSP1176-20130426/7943_1 /TAXON_ID=265551 /ORGANISM="Synedropsis recta cf, Strain CCMP1620" /LENGTH=173 /DNA_ID=CAMNT_0006966165 /DNA_START=66 /DNA_END=587 /DNA_ORIENTATION=+